LGLAIGLAAPLAADDAVERFLAEGDMTFTLDEADKLAVYNVTTADGYTFKLSETEDGYTFTLDEARGPATPQSGNWSRRFDPTRIDCSTNRDMRAAIQLMIGRFDELVNNFLGSTDGGRTAPYEFTAPFGAEQLLGRILEVLEMAEISSEVTYGSDGGYMHTAQGQLSQPSDFTVSFKMELFAGRCLIMGDWYGAAVDNPSCQAWGLVQWQREGGGCDL
jgi:hypothetical protein